MEKNKNVVVPSKVVGIFEKVKIFGLENLMIKRILRRIFLFQKLLVKMLEMVKRLLLKSLRNQLKEENLKEKLLKF